MIKKVKNFVMRIVHMKYKKYIIVAALGVVIVGFVGESSVLAHLRNNKIISELRQNVQHFADENQRNLDRIYELQHSPKAMERVAREMHFMKADDEDIFTLSDDIVQQDNNNETVR
jgi:cell division protein FtsB